MAETLMLPAVIVLLGAVAALFFVRPTFAAWKPARDGRAASDVAVVPTEPVARA
jgi:hypothetical protein